MPGGVTLSGHTEDWRSLYREMLHPCISPPWCFKLVAKVLCLLSDDSVVTKIHNADGINTSSQIIDGIPGDPKLSRTDDVADIKATWLP
jgi:hypothetical protein